MILTVTREFEVATSSRDGKIIAKPGDQLKVEDKGFDYFYIKRLNDKPIFSTWKRKNWVLSHCNKPMNENKMNPTSTRSKIKALKIKMQNLELEIQSLISGAEFEPGTIDAVYQDITNFTDEIRDISKQLLALKSKKNESMSLVDVYEGMKNEGFYGTKYGGGDNNSKHYSWDDVVERFEELVVPIQKTNPTAFITWLKNNYNPPIRKK